MGNSQNNTTISQTVLNSAIQMSKNVCSFQCGTKNINTNIIINDSSDVTIDFQQTCSVLGTSCTVKNVLDTSVTNVLQSSSSQTVSNVATFLNFDKTKNSTSITQDIRNNMSQLISNVCQNVAQTSNENIYVYINGSKNINLNFAQAGNISNANCAYDNSAKIAIFNQATAKASQSVKNIGILGAIMIIIVLIIGAFVLFALLGTMKKKDDGNGKKPPPK